MTIIKIKNTLSEEYKIIIKKGLFSSLAKIIKNNFQSQNYFLITVPPLEKLYLNNIKQQFRDSKLLLKTIIINDGEQSKCISVVNEILDFLFTNEANRNSILIAFGGGVVGDIVGFTASIFMRGIKYIQIATSLIAQVDSSIGGKTGIDSSYGKNLVGTFYQPSLVLIDPDILSTLPDIEYINGLAEIVKYGILNKQIFSILEKNIQEIKSRNYNVLINIIIKCCRFKAKVVSTDLYDNNIRAILNLGHTIGHALEKITNYKYFKHGEAIAWGMLAACNLAKKNFKFE